tara:strand:+ start:29 stop:847 length:819 start_codon:yes stop_codon:yes gene_type:complete
MNKKKYLILIILLCSLITSCTLSSRLAKPLTFTKQTEVFDVKIYATDGVEDTKMLHAANVLAEYLDNNEDGIIDDSNVHTHIKNRKTYLVLYKDEDEETQGGIIWSFSQNLYNMEIFPQGSSPGEFDATLEEVLHLITDHGYAQAYPDIFGVKKGSKVALAMDTARGGYYEDVPSSYPSNSWYHYYDDTCNYSCMVTEYFYWALTSKLGAQEYPGRYDEIKDEWNVSSSANLQIVDPTINTLLDQYQTSNILPSVLPDGTYLPTTFTISELK